MWPFGKNAISRAKDATKDQWGESPFFDTQAQSALGGFTDVALNDRMIQRHTGRQGVVHYWLDDNDYPHVVYPHYIVGNQGRAEVVESDINCVLIDGALVKVDMATGKLGDVYKRLR